MDVSLVFGIVFWLILLGMLAHWLFNKLMIRFFPKYAANRRLKAQTRSDRWLQKREKRQADEKARLLVWAKKHPDDPAAKAVLVEEDASSTTSGMSSAGVESDPLVELRRRQQEADDYERRKEARKAAEEMRSQQLLEWAIANPTTPEGRRHLEEALYEANQQTERADRDISFARFAAKDDGPEAIETATSIAEAEARKASGEELIRKIQVALTKAPSDSER